MGFVPGTKLLAALAFDDIRHLLGREAVHVLEISRIEKVTQHAGSSRQL